MQARLLIVPVLLLAAAGCRGPGYYADQPPAEIAEMVQVQLADLGPGEARYTAPTIAGARSYRLAARKDLGSGRASHVLSVEESASGEARFPSFARAEAEARVCRLTSAKLAAGPEGAPSSPADFALADEGASCHPAEDCDTYPETYKEKYQDDDGDIKKRTVRRYVRHCEEFWRCRSERRYQITVDDRSLRAARHLPDGMSAELGWDCGGMGLHTDRLELPPAYLDGYLLAVDRDPYALSASEPAP